MEYPKWQIRDFEAVDYEHVLDLWKQTDLGGAQRGDDLKVIQATLNSGGKFLVMHDSKDGTLIGTSWITNDHRRLYLHHFGVLPAYQKMGLSKPLLKASLQYAKEMNLQIKLEVHKGNELAVNLYSNGGFSFLGDYDVYIIRDLSKF
jgi:[ribosomal protein S18]-alanine N-acetyltransferase